MPLTFQMIPRELWQKIFIFLDLDKGRLKEEADILPLSTGMGGGGWGQIKKSF